MVRINKHNIIVLFTDLKINIDFSSDFSIETILLKLREVTGAKK